jgi:hypothetical protein
MRIQARVVFGVPVLALAACGGGGGGNNGGANPPPPPPAPATYTVGGVVSGLNGTLVLQNNAGNNLSTNSNGAFAFSTSVVTGAAYAITVLTQPAGQTCTTGNASGSVAATNVTTITVTCVSNPLAYLSSTPQSGSTEAARTETPVLTFDRPLNASTVSAAVTFTSIAGAEPMTVNGSGAAITITPTRRLLPMTLYTMSVSTDVRGSNGELLATAASATFATRDGVWQPSSALRATPLPTGYRDEKAKIVSDVNGNAIAVWPQSNGTRRDLMASRYQPVTGWSAPELIEAENLGDATDPDVAVDAAGNVTAVWRQDDGTRYNAWSNRFSASVAGGSWGIPTLIESTAGTVSGVRVAANSAGAVTAVFGQTDGVRVNLWSNRFSSAAWGTPAMIETNNTSSVTDYSVAADAQNNAVAVWRQSDGTRNNIWSNSSTSATWGIAELRETSDAGTAYAPQVAMDANGTIAVVWAQDNGANREMIANRFLPGSGWSGTRVLDTSGVALSMAVGFDKTGRAFATWGCDHSGLRVCLSNFGMGGNAWSPLSSSAVTTASSTSGLRMTVDGGGHVMATWMTQDSYLVGPNQVYTARPTALRYLLSLGGWGAAEFLDALETYSNTPLANDSRLQSVIEASGSVIVIWPNEAGALMTKRFE